MRCVYNIIMSLQRGGCILWPLKNTHRISLLAQVLGFWHLFDLVLMSLPSFWDAVPVCQAKAEGSTGHVQLLSSGFYLAHRPCLLQLI